ncbi:hypothetical protein HRI_000822500 [Hibiscus trionum]|uniref:Wall-associated receptor kinase galacturonan-binding domain-containing protein n=1 Tax=Hibiscus trionum TaxID=183268 RepID=A0A9W7H6I8_HIBTR|nr:hypothetical protein HRI_000822500 [Hibiscus trionum]
MKHTLPSISFIHLLLFVHLPISYTQENANFMQCFDPFPCGNVQNLVFPFWREGSSPEFCQAQGFGLTKCEEDDPPLISIGGHEFRLVSVNQSGYSMTIARGDLWETICPPPPISNITLGYPFLGFSPTNRNFTFFYGCDSSVAPPRGGGPMTECTQWSNSFYADDIDDGSSYQQFRQLCRGGAIQVQINQSNFEQLRREAENLGSVRWRLGFDVVYDLPDVFCGKLWVPRFEHHS